MAENAHAAAAFERNTSGIAVSPWGVVGWYRPCELLLCREVCLPRRKDDIFEMLFPVELHTPHPFKPA
jgi:hypothetical protein